MGPLEYQIIKNISKCWNTILQSLPQIDISPGIDTIFLSRLVYLSGGLYYKGKWEVYGNNKHKKKGKIYLKKIK